MLVTVPAPDPFFVTASVNILSANTAETLRADVMETVHVPVPVHAPDHPLNVDEMSGTAVKVTVVPWEYDALQPAPHEIPAGLLLTVPVPVPIFATDNRYVFSANVAVTLRA